MTTQQPFWPEDVPDLILPEEPWGDSLRRSSGCFCKSVRVLTTSFMPGLLSGCAAQHISMRVLSEEGHMAGMGRLYPFATCVSELTTFGNQCTPSVTSYTLASNSLQHLNTHSSVPKLRNAF